VRSFSHSFFSVVHTYDVFLVLDDTRKERVGGRLGRVGFNDGAGFGWFQDAGQVVFEAVDYVFQKTQVFSELRSGTCVSTIGFVYNCGGALDDCLHVVIPLLHCCLYHLLSLRLIIRKRTSGYRIFKGRV